MRTALPVRRCPFMLCNSALMPCKVADVYEANECTICSGTGVQLELQLAATAASVTVALVRTMGL